MIPIVQLNDFEIVPMEECHLDDVLIIENGYSANPWSRELFIRELENRFSYNFILKNLNNIIGFTNFWALFEVIELNNIALKEECRGKGFGSKFLEFIIESSKVLNAKRIFLEVSNNNLAAYNLYRKTGFIDIGIRKKYYKNGSDAILMEKIL